MDSPFDTLTITRPDDWHLHVRDGDALRTVVPHTAAQFGRAIIMPNLKPPVTTAAQAVAYRDRIRAAVPAGVSFKPLMTLYLTDNLPPEEIARAKDAGVVALKLYPAGATTNSDAGVTDIRKTYRTLEAMQREGLLLLVHYNNCRLELCYPCLRLLRFLLDRFQHVFSLCDGLDVGRVGVTARHSLQLRQVVI